MENKIYKYGFLSVCGVGAAIILYLAVYGAIERADAFATHLNGGMSPEDVRYMVCISQDDPDRVQVCDALIEAYEGIK